MKVVQMYVTLFHLDNSEWFQAKYWPPFP